MKYGIPSKKGYEINYKRYFLASKIGNKSIINNIMGVFKIMVKSIINKLENVLIWVGYNWVGYKVDIIALEEEIKELKKINDNSFKLIEKDIKALELTMTMAKEEHESLKNVHNNLARDFSELKFKNDNLQDSHTRNVIIPKCKEMLKDYERGE